MSIPEARASQGGAGEVGGEAVTLPLTSERWEIVRGGGPHGTILIRQAITSGEYVAEIQPEPSDDLLLVSRRARLIEAAPELAELLQETLDLAGEPLPRAALRYRDAATRARHLLGGLE